VSCSRPAVTTTTGRWPSSSNRRRTGTRHVRRTSPAIVRGNGRGGRCAEFLLWLGIELAGQDGTWALACDTDGIDGSEDNAGAVLAPNALADARAAGLDPQRLARNNDAYSFFQVLGDLVVTGPTRTNVNDYRVIFIQ
jgi:hydroxypyruvate reductase